MAHFAAAAPKNPPWAHGTAGINLGAGGTGGNHQQQQGGGGNQVAVPSQQGGNSNALGPGSLGATLLAAQATAVNNMAASLVAATPQPPTSVATFSNTLAAISITQNPLQPGTVLSQQSLAGLPVSLASTQQVNTGNVMVDLTRMSQQTGAAAAAALAAGLPASTSHPQLAAVSYPTPRLLAAQQQQQSHQQQQQHHHLQQQLALLGQQQQQQQQQQQFTNTQQASPSFPPRSMGSSINNNNSTICNTGKQRIYTGTITKLLDNFGFVDDEVFFQLNVVKGGIPKVGDRVLVESSFNLNMPFKWNASRVQILPNQNLGSISSMNQFVVNQPPPSMLSITHASTHQQSQGSSRFSSQGQSAWLGSGMGSSMRRHSPPAPSSSSQSQQQLSSRRDRDNNNRRGRERKSSPPSSSSRKRSRSPRRSRSRTPPRRRPRYTVQVPQISLDMREGNVLELKKRYFNLYIPSDFCYSRFLWQEAFAPHTPLVLDRPCSFHVLHKDVDPLEPIDTVLDPPDADHRFSAKVMLLAVPPLKDLFQKSCGLAQESGDSLVHPTRLLYFLVGLKGKNETMALGGPWSASLDGSDPEGDPAVLIRTAIRTCKALTGIDLSPCTQWCRFLELHYRRGGRSQRMETTVIFLPDVWTVMPSRLEWDNLGASYKRALHKRLSPTDAAAMDQGKAAADEDSDGKSLPTHHSELDPKTMKIIELKQELEARNLSTKGLKTQLIARLSKALKSEQEQEQDSAHDDAENTLQQSDSKMNEEDEKKAEEEEKRTRDLEKQYTLPEEPAILVHPSRTAKSGRFDCTLMSLSVLLDYRQEDNKEHSFEVSLFAELFNEMLMRDFGFRIYRSLAEYPESKEEEDDKKEKDKKRDKKSDEKKDKKDKKDDNKKKEEDKESDDKEEDGDSEEEEDEDRDRRKRRKKLQMYTADPYLLLSFVYFDQNHTGYILEKDLEDILFTLGLHLSRAQVRKLLQKVIKRDSLEYRKLTDRPVPEDSPGDFLEHTIRHEEDPGSKLEELALGNRRMLPLFSQAPDSSGMKKENNDIGAEEEEAPEIGLVRFQGRTLDLDQLLKQLSRKDRTCLETEERMREMEEELGELKEMAMEKDKENKKLKSDLDKFKGSLKCTEEDLHCAITENDKLKKSLNISRDQLKTIVSNIDLALKSSTSLSGLGEHSGMYLNGLESSSNSSFPSPSSARRKASKFDSRSSKHDVKPPSFSEQGTSSTTLNSSSKLPKGEPKSDPSLNGDLKKRSMDDASHEGIQTKYSKKEAVAEENVIKSAKIETEGSPPKQPEAGHSENPSEQPRKDPVQDPTKNPTNKNEHQNSLTHHSTSQIGPEKDVCTHSSTSGTSSDISTLADNIKVPEVDTESSDKVEVKYIDKLTDTIIKSRMDSSGNNQECLPSNEITSHVSSESISKEDTPTSST